MRTIHPRPFRFSTTLLGLVLLGGAFQNCTGSFQTKVVAPDLAQLDSFNYSDGSDANESAGPNAGPFQCRENVDPSSVPLRRLSKTEYVNTLKHLLGFQNSSDFSAIMNELNPLLATIPNDVDEKFSRLDTTLDQAHLLGYLFVAKKVGELITANDTRAKKFFGSCATAAAMNSSCLNQFFSGMGKRIYRRPLTNEEITSLKNDYNAYGADKNSFLAARMLMSTYFLMHVENQGTEISTGLLKISPYELASRLSFHFLESMPDDELLDAAADGSLQTNSGLDAQINRLMGATYKTRTKDTIAEFYSQWLGLDQLPNPANSTGSAYEAFAAGDRLTKSSMIQEIEDMTDYYTFSVNGNFKDLLTSNVSFAKNQDLADIYGVAKWSGDPNALVTLPEGERSGLLTRAALLANPTTATNPVTRGVKIRRDILCDTLAPPPASIANMLRVPEIDPSFTTRERFEHKTADPFCMACHTKINPLGFALEVYDPLGRYRTSEKIFDNAGNYLSQKAIDPVVMPEVFPDDQRVSSNAVEFSELIAESGKAQNCFVQQYFEFTYHKAPDPQKDGCALEDLRQNLASQDGSLQKMFLNVVKSKAFQLRSIAP